MSARPQQTPTRRSPGRRAGESGTREAILDAAQELFAAGGYEATSMRAVAARADVDPGLVRYFFGDKAQLFAAAMVQRSIIPESLAAAIEGDPGSVGRRVSAAYLGLWEDPVTQPVLLGLIRSAMTSRAAVQMFIETLAPRVLGDERAPSPKDPRVRRFALALTHLLGVGVARHVLKIPVVADLTREEWVEMLAPEIQAYLGPQEA